MCWLHSPFGSNLLVQPVLRDSDQFYYYDSFTTSSTPSGSFQVQVTGTPLGATTVPTGFTVTVTPPTLFSSTIFYGTVGGIVAFLAIAIAAVALRRRKQYSSALLRER